MRSRSLLALLALASLSASPGAAQQRPAPDALDVSSYMMPPRSSWAAVGPSADPAVTVSEKGGDGELAFRVLHLRAGVKATKQAAVDLAKSKLVETGDVLLSFRPLWDKTLAYAHMQLGVSHTAIAFIVSDGVDPFVMTLESPISYSSPLNAPEHYADLDAIHVVRPQLDAAQKRNLEKWAKLIFARRSRFSFFSDYSKPMYKRGLVDVAKPNDEIRRLAKAAAGPANLQFESYCSEFVWSLLGLRNCDPGAFSDGCVSPIFGTADGMLTGLVPKIAGDAGLAQGPEAALVGGKIADETKTTTLTQSVFVDVLTDDTQLSGRMSEGHRAVARANKQNMTVLNGYYATGEPAALAVQIDQGVTDNVSPTSFLLRSNAGLDGFRYVGTIVFDR